MESAIMGSSVAAAMMVRRFFFVRTRRSLMMSLLLLVCYAESDSRSFEFPAGNLLVSRQFRPPTP
jgi:hypothetical protein